MTRLNTYDVRVIPHDQHRYETVGDYWDEGTNTFVRVSEMGDARYEFLVAIHEFIEEFLCKHRGIPEPVIKAFDEAFELARPEGNTDEPGDSFDAPYREEHAFATYIERLIAEQLGVNWDEYGKVVTAL